MQDNLRAEIIKQSVQDPTYEELMTSLPYLDAVTCETLRLHPPGGQVFRQVCGKFQTEAQNHTLKPPFFKAYEDDVVPLSEPILDAQGNSIDCIYIPKGTIVRIPTAIVGRSKGLWGDHGDKFVPDRWLNNNDNSVSGGANGIQGYRRLLAFSDGPRTCPGKGMALVEFKVCRVPEVEMRGADQICKAILSVLIRHYVFELPDGADTKFEGHISLLERPKTVGQNGCRVPMIIKRSRL